MNGLKSGELHKNCVQYELKMHYFVFSKVKNSSMPVSLPLQINYIRNFENRFEIGQVCLMMFSKRFL